MVAAKRREKHFGGSMEEDDASGKSNGDSISPTPKQVFISTLRATLGMLQRGSVIPPSALQQLRPVSKSVSQLLEAYNHRLRDNTSGGLDDFRQSLIRRVEREIDECAVDLDSTPNPPDRGTIKIRRHVSQKKVIANHQKAFRSTGPRTREGNPPQESKACNCCFGPYSPDHCSYSSPVSAIRRGSGCSHHKGTYRHLGKYSL